jgi:NAD(P)-dependent dehydrogenase (short-subunit alcohol dehydrogenase family)
MSQSELISKRLDGKIAVITGGSSGIGLATAQRFVQEGAYAFIFGRGQSEIDAAVRGIGKNVIGVQGDVSNLADLDRLYEMVKQQKGRIDILFANAGILEFAPLGSITESHFDKSFDINVQRPSLHRTKSASAVSGWWLDNFNCFGQRIQRIRSDECL